MRHPSLREFEHRLRRLFDEIDEELENAYGSRYQLHPARAPRGTTSRSTSDGLFNVGATFSAGYGSQHGRGYVVQVDMVTLERVPADVREAIERDVAEMINRGLRRYFPERELRVDRDRNSYKIHGDLRLGEM